jgi:hypothetical protein
MKRSFSICMGLFFGFLLTLAVATQAKAQDKSKAKEDRLTGSIHMINKDTSTVTIRRGNVQRQVVYNADTKITYRNKPGSMDDVKEGRRVICLGKFNDKTQLVATRIDVREGK